MALSKFLAEVLFGKLGCDSRYSKIRLALTFLIVAGLPSSSKIVTERNREEQIGTICG